MPLLDGSDPLADGADDGPGVDVLPPEPEPEEPGKLIAVTPDVPRRSRRAQAEEDRTREMKELRGTLDELRSGLGQRDQALAEMRGMLQANLQRPVMIQQAPPPQRSAGDPTDVEKLEREAMEALDRKDFTTYQRKSRAASVMAAKQEVMAEMQQFQQRNPAPQAPAAMPQELIPLFAAHPEVAQHPNAVNLLMAKAVEAEARGIPPGPQRSQFAFSEVAALIKGRNGTNGGGRQFDQRTRGALSGVPTTMGGASAPGGGQTGVVLSADERAIAKMAGMSEADYARDVALNHPERLER